MNISTSLRRMPDQMFERVGWVLEFLASALAVPPHRMRCIVIVCYGEHLVNCRAVGTIAKTDLPGVLRTVAENPERYL
jgi:hypothetical protein